MNTQTNTQTRPSAFWTQWLVAVTLGVMAFGLALVLAPRIAQQGFSLLVYGDAQRIAAFDPQAVQYIGLVHAVLGAVMVGWGLSMLLVVRSLFARGAKEGWHIVAVSVAAWFVPDTTFSLWSGFWQNAALNLVFIILFAIPLVATYRDFHPSRT
jgi:hypothetical protein